MVKVISRKKALTLLAEGKTDGLYVSTNYIVDDLQKNTRFLMYPITERASSQMADECVYLRFKS